MLKFTVLMSVYKKENPIYFRQALDSVIHQSCQPDEILVVQDGELTPELYKVCAEYKSIINVLPLKENVGLGKALQIGVENARYNIVARMDTDDIAKANRFELQLKEFERDTELSLCGSCIEEFDDNVSNPTTQRRVPFSEEDIYEYGKRRNPFNHTTVMFKRDDVLAVGNYQPFYLSEDYYLWYRMIRLKYKMKNLPDMLVSVRAGSEMIRRRGGWRYFTQEIKLYSIFFKDGYVNVFEYVYILLIRFCARMMPGWARTILYRSILR